MPSLELGKIHVDLNIFHPNVSLVGAIGVVQIPDLLDVVRLVRVDFRIRKEMVVRDVH